MTQNPKAESGGGRYRLNNLLCIVMAIQYVPTVVPVSLC